MEEMEMRFSKLAIFALALSASSVTTAAPTKELPYPTGSVSANEIADQVYFVNHFYAVKNISFERKRVT